MKVLVREESSPKNVIDRIDSDASNAGKEGKQSTADGKGGNESSESSGDGSERMPRRRSSVKPTRYQAGPASSPKKKAAPKPAPKAAKSSPKAAAGSPKGSNKGKKLSKVTPTPPRTGMWADEEHEQFKEGVVLYGEHLICGI